MQNELTEFFNMVNFCNPGVLGSNADFKRRCVRRVALCVVVTLTTW
jgi:SNF2 family DNA or RNA helicase